jgi:hypothetical protein
MIRKATAIEGRAAKIKTEAFALRVTRNWKNLEGFVARHQ